MSDFLLAFARPWWLLAVLPLGWLVWRMWRAPHLAASSWKQVIDAHLLPHLLTDATPGGRRGWLAVLAVGLLLAVLALAGPTLDRQQDERLRRPALRVLVIDLSPQAAPQLERIKAKAASLLRALPRGETALIVYGEEPYLVVPPTLDPDIVARFIPELAVDALPVAGNRPERALGMARALLERNGSAASRDIVWLAAEAGPVHAAAPQPDARVMLLHAHASVEKAPPKAASRTGWLLQPMQDDDSDVRQLAAALSSDTAWIVGTAPGGGRNDAGYWILPLLLPLAAFAFRRGVLMLAVPVLCTGLLAPPPAEAAGLTDYIAHRLLAFGKPDAAAAAFADPQWQAIAHYRAGRYEEAARLLAGRNEPDALYNRGNALAKEGKLVDALASYDASLALRPNDADTLHNRDLVRRLLNQQNRQGNQARPPEQQSRSDAERVAEQWLRGVPDEPQTLLRRKLALEHQLRVSGKAERPW